MSKDRTEQQREHFNSIAQRYREARGHINHKTLKRLLWSSFWASARLELPARPRVLEAMCGFCDGKQILDEHLGLPFDYSAFDYSDEVVDTLRDEHPDWDVFHADVTTWHSPDPFDLVILLGGLHHVPFDAPEAIANIGRSMSPGGYFINLEPTHGNPFFHAARAMLYHTNSLFDEQTERAFRVSEYHAMFHEAGFEPVSIFYPGLLSYVLYYNPDAFPLLNVGGPEHVERLFSLELPFMHTRLASVFSFATLALWRKAR